MKNEFKKLPHAERRHVKSSASYWWLRYPNTGNANNEYNVNTSGASNNNNANNSNGFSPDCFILKVESFRNDQARDVPSQRKLKHGK